jgi:YebC/PmpR family DNA-binding regulatory protein
MSGHSHWAQVKHKKAIVDAKRSKVVSKLMNAILVAVRDGSNPETNYKLKIAIERARDFGVSTESIDRALKKATGELKSGGLEEVIYEAYGPDNVALLIKTATDNRNRTLSEIRQILNSTGGKLATPGSALWLFDERGVIVIRKQSLMEEMIDRLIGRGLIDWREQDGEIVLITDPQQLGDISQEIKRAGIEVSEESLEFLPKNSLKISEQSQLAVKKLIEKLLDHPEVQEVYSNIL